jgi:hypothetical protein
MKLGDFATGAALAGVLALIGFCFCLWLALGRPSPAPSESCWRDPRASTILDFDFHTFVDGRPIRCGYMPPRANSVLPRVVGEVDRGVFSDVLCYPLEPIKCP